MNPSKVRLVYWPLKGNAGLWTFDHAPLCIWLIPSSCIMPYMCASELHVTAYNYTENGQAKCQDLSHIWSNRVKPRMRNGLVVDRRRFNGFQGYVNEGSKWKPTSVTALLVVVIISVFSPCKHFVFQLRKISNDAGMPIRSDPFFQWFVSGVDNVEPLFRQLKQDRLDLQHGRIAREETRLWWDIPLLAIAGECVNISLTITRLNILTLISIEICVYTWYCDRIFQY